MFIRQMILLNLSFHFIFPIKIKVINIESVGENRISAGNLLLCVDDAYKRSHRP